MEKFLRPSIVIEQTIEQSRSPRLRVVLGQAGPCLLRHFLCSNSWSKMRGTRRLQVTLEMCISIIFLQLGVGKSCLPGVSAYDVSMPGDRGRRMRSGLMSPCIMYNSGANKPNKEDFVNFNHSSLTKFALLSCGLFKNVTHSFNGFSLFASSYFINLGMILENMYYKFILFQKF